MGIFRDFKDMTDTYRSDELKEIRRTAGAMPKTSMLDGVKAANQALGQAQAWQGQAAANPMPVAPGAMGAANPMAGANPYATGTPASATVQAISHTGTQVNSAQVLNLELLVTVPGQEPYPVTLTQPIHPVQIPHFQPGATFPVHVDPSNPSTVSMG